ncbi:hypothetical protein FHW84_000794 [Dyella sp. SG562]|uniref:hypothetical protein n=1 Tax=Dyella TaxID=231454 RepID=UPI001420B28A|nr:MULTISPECIES: hypothetical protein [unclassified Dyella]NII72228.1 hypothetical protein [Dyella sp. SG562]NKJ22570.1 hypothetical protein [Dyella sp. SG609]
MHSPDPINRALMAYRPLFLSGLSLDGQYRPSPKPARRKPQPASGLAATLAIAAAAWHAIRGNAR